MTLPLIGLAVLAVVIFAFVLEPVLRARGDRVELDAAVLSRLSQRRTGDDDLLVSPDEELQRAEQHDGERAGRPSGAAVERRAAGDLS